MCYNQLYSWAQFWREKKEIFSKFWEKLEEILPFFSTTSTTYSAFVWLYNALLLEKQNRSYFWRNSSISPKIYDQTSSFPSLTTARPIQLPPPKKKRRRTKTLRPWSSRFWTKWLFSFNRRIHFINQDGENVCLEVPYHSIKGHLNPKRPFGELKTDCSSIFLFKNHSPC